MVCRSEARIDTQGRIVLDGRVRGWLGVSRPALFEAALLPLPSGGVLVVPVEGFARRVEAVTP